MEAKGKALHETVRCPLLQLWKNIDIFLDSSLPADTEQIREAVAFSSLKAKQILRGPYAGKADRPGPFPAFKDLLGFPGNPIACLLTGKDGNIAQTKQFKLGEAAKRAQVTD